MIIGLHELNQPSYAHRTSVFLSESILKSPLSYFFISKVYLFECALRVELLIFIFAIWISVLYFLAKECCL